MSSTELRDNMMEYIEIESKSEVSKSISPRPKDKEYLQDLVVDEPTDDHHPSQNGSRVAVEQGNSSNGCHSQKNEFHTASEETTREDDSSTTNGTVIPPSGQTVSNAEPLKQNGTRGLDVVNISNGDSQNGLRDSSSDDDTSEKDAENGLNGEPTEEVSNNGEDVVKEKLQMSKEMDKSMQEHENSSNSFSVSGTESTSVVNGALKQDVVIEDTDQQRDGLKRDEKVSVLVTEGVVSDQDGYHSSGDESVASTVCDAEHNVVTDAESRNQFSEQVLKYLNSSEMQSKIKEINNLVEHMSASSFKSLTSTVGDEMKPDGPDIESNKSEPEDESTFPKRTSKQSEFEDPEELQLISKKLKMSKTVDNTLEGQSNDESQSWVSKQFRLAYEKAFQEVPAGQKHKEFNFAETGESSKEMLKEDLNQIAERVLRAMSLEHCFLHEEIESRMTIEENLSDGIDDPSEIQEKKELGLLAQEWIGKWFSNDSYPKVRISPNLEQNLRDSCLKNGKSNGSLAAFSRRPSTQDGTEASAFRAMGCETSNRRVLKFPSFFELIKIVFLMCCLIPFFLTTCVTSKLFEICFPIEKRCKRPTTLNGEQRVKDEAPN